MFKKAQPAARRSRSDQACDALFVCIGVALWLFTNSLPAWGQLPANKAELDEMISADNVQHKDWPWGQLDFNSSYRFSIEVTNKCPTTQQLMLVPDENLDAYIRGEPIRTIPANVKKFDVWVPVRVGPPGGFVSTLHESISPTGSRMLTWSRLEIEGQLYVTGLSRGSECFYYPKVYNASGHIYNIPGNDPLISDCWTYWRQSLRPPATWDCTEAFRGFAIAYLASLGDPEELRRSAAWSWLPTESRIMGMTDLQLLEMKNRAEAQRLDTLSRGR